MPQAVVSVVHVSKQFGDLVAVDDIGFEIIAGSTTALLGGNGAGKTTTISMLLGLLLPTAGSISVFGHDMLRDRYAVLPRMNFSSPYVDLPRRLTVRQNLLIYADLYGLADKRTRLRQLAEELYLAEMMDRPYGQLSAGQKTRVAIAKA
ncbi:MAG TPA: ABC transporter ATP-binding protein, partial [Burkholderiales bacterium]|nr:ABC transporter ATP-binding protein [Burkholderiales bacterium]